MVIISETPSTKHETLFEHHPIKNLEFVAVHMSIEMIVLGKNSVRRT